MSLYNKTIKTAKSYDQVEYNKHIINLSQYRLDLVNKGPTIPDIEKAINAGQVEELIVQAEEELELLINMNEDFRIWEPDPEAEAEVDSWRNEMFNRPMDPPDKELFEKYGLEKDYEEMWENKHGPSM